MHLDLVLIAAGAVVGMLVGLTGTGGGALMTPMLVLAFGVAPATAIASDLVATVLMRPVGALVHWRRHKVDGRVVALLCSGSLPAAIVGTYVMHRLGTGSATVVPQRLLGGALVIGASAMAIRQVFARATPRVSDCRGAAAATVVTGVLGGFLVGLTSVGAGSIMMMALALLYPSMSSDRLVGTDLAQSVPLALGASVGALIFGHVSLSVTVAVATGAVPATYLGALISSKRASDAVRPLIAGIVLLSGLHYLGVATPSLAVATIPLFALLAVSFWPRRAVARDDRHDAACTPSDARTRARLPSPTGRGTDTAATSSVAEPVEGVVSPLPPRFNRDA